MVHERRQGTGSTEKVNKIWNNTCCVCARQLLQYTQLAWARHEWIYFNVLQRSKHMRIAAPSNGQIYHTYPQHVFRRDWTKTQQQPKNPSSNERKIHLDTLVILVVMRCNAKHATPCENEKHFAYSRLFIYWWMVAFNLRSLCIRSILLKSELCSFGLSCVAPFHVQVTVKSMILY